MSGYWSDDLRHHCELDGCYQNVVLPNWEWMRGCFPRGIMPMDIDGLIELGGQFLVLDHKRPQADFTPGARTALRRLGDLPEVTVLGLRADATAEPEDVYEYTQLSCAVNNGPLPWRQATQQQLRSWLQRWAEAADKRGAGK